MYKKNTYEVDVEEYFICVHCIENTYLKSEIVQNGQQSECSYCGKKGKTITIGDLASHVDKAFEDHFRLTSIEPEGIEYARHADKETFYLWERNVDPATSAISMATSIDEVPAEHIRQVLYNRHFDYESAAQGEENPFDSEACYEKKDIGDYELHKGWTACQESLKTEIRLFNPRVEDILDHIFEDLSEFKTYGPDSVIVDAGPEHPISKLYRARVFQSEKKLKTALENPDREIGPPSFSTATAGRMNAQGISLFYGATESDVALAEVRPPVGSDVVIACFNLIRPLSLLNIEALGGIYVDGSIFDPSYIFRRQKAKFLTWLSSRLIQPVMPDDEAADYLVTQAISDYLASRTKQKLDGIIYRSSQTSSNGQNVSLFWKSSCVEKSEIPEGTVFDTHLYHSHYYSSQKPVHSVTEHVPEDSGKKDEEARHSSFAHQLEFSAQKHEKDRRTPALRLDLKTMTVHQIKGISVKTTSYSVERHRVTESRQHKRTN